jgi:hypothetical protein
LSSKHLASVEHTSTDTTATTINCPRIVESRLSLILVHQPALENKHTTYFFTYNTGITVDNT